MENPLVLNPAQIESRAFIAKVYGWMSIGLAVTGACAAYMISDPGMIVNLIHKPILFYGLLFGELALVLFLSARIRSMEAGTARFVFLFYSALNGVTMSVIFLAYTSASIASTFFITAGTFAAMSAYGAMTKTDLTSVGNFCFMGLIGIVIASLVNIFVKSPAVSWALSYIGVLVFVGLTAYDTQKLKALGGLTAEGSDEQSKLAISGALTLYLDFINLFLSLLRILGRRRD